MLKKNIKQQLSSIELAVAEAFKNWRMNHAKLSQQNLHDFCKAYDIPVYNSQIAYLEKANLDAKRTMYFGLEHMNKELADKKNNYLKIENKTLREKLKKAKPFLSADNRVADKFDFSAIFLGAEINKKYVTSNSITVNDELALRYSKLVREEFHNVRRELMVTGKEVLYMIIHTKTGKKTSQEDINKLKDVITDEYVFNGKDIEHLLKEYGTLPCCEELNEVKPNEQLQDLCKRIGVCT